MLIHQYKTISKELEALGFFPHANDMRYYCTPCNAVIIGGLGCDGVHFAAIPSDVNIKNMPIFVIYPLSPYDKEIVCVAETFDDFLSLLISTKHAMAIQIAGMGNKADFLEFIKNEVGQMKIHPEHERQKETAIRTITSLYPQAKLINDPYEYIQTIKMKYNDMEFVVPGE